jgi:predicted nucleic acid-binding protein
VRFVDTNVLLYAISSDPEEVAKAKVANAILDAADLGLSVQVLQEFYVQATRSSRRDAISHEQAVGLVDSWRRFPVQDTTLAIMDRAFATKARFGISYWDAAVVEASRALGCSLILSEDLDPGTDFDGVRIENPFR